MRTVFLSSTSVDLKEYRQAVYDAIEGLDGYHCVRMENFGSRNASAASFDEERVQACDVFVGLLGDCYGSSPTGQEKSYSELEYDAAVRANKPRLMFLSEQSVVVHDRVEPPECRRRQELFRSRVSVDRLWGTPFTSPVDLAFKVTVAISNWQQTAEPTETVKLGYHSLAPRPPVEYLAHPYPLADHFTGRQRERALLSAWLSDDDRPVLVVTGMGGLGKSSLAWVWLNVDVLSRAVPGVAPCRAAPSQRPSGILWWSFYDTEASFDAFLNESLMYASSGSLSPAALSSPYAKARMLLAVAQSHNFLFVLDGFERLLRAYAGLGGAYDSEGVPEVGRNSPHTCVDPLVAKFLRWIATGCVHSRFLLTSRLFPKDLEGFGGAPLAGCRREMLDAMDPLDAVAMFRSMGIVGTSAEMRSVCAPYGYHALTLRVLAGYVTTHLEQPYDIAVAPRFDPLADAATGRRHVLDVAYEALPSESQQLVSRLAAFRYPVDLRGVAALGVLDAPAELEHAMRDLIHRGLVTVEARTNRFDMHPLTRQYAYQRLGDKGEVHERLRIFLASAVAEATTSGEVIDLAQLSMLGELYRQTALANRHDEAYRLYRDRLVEPLARLGAHAIEIELLDGLVMDRDGEVTVLVTEVDAQVDILMWLSIAYGYTGQPRRASHLLSAAASFPDHKAQESPIGNLTYFQMKLGELTLAEATQRRGLELAQKHHNASDTAFGRMRLGLILSYQGRSAEAIPLFRAASGYFQRRQEFVGECHLWSYRAVRAGLTDDLDLALLCGRRAVSLARAVKDSRLVARASALLASSLVQAVVENRRLPKGYGRSSALTEAEALLLEALSICGQRDLIDVEVKVRVAWSEWSSAMGSLMDAYETAEQGLFIAERCGYRLDAVDTHLALAKVSIAVGDTKQACQHAMSAKQLARASGGRGEYPYAAHRADAILANINSGSEVTPATNE